MIDNPYRQYQIVQPSFGPSTASPGTLFSNATVAAALLLKTWDADGMWLVFQTTAVSGNHAGIKAVSTPSTGDDGVQLIVKPEFFAVMKTAASVAAIQFQVGLTSNAVTSPDATQHEAKFFYDTNVHGTAFWRCVTDSASGAPTVTVTTVAVTANTKYRFKIDCSVTGTIDFYIDDILVATHTTKLPGSTTNISHCVTVKTRAAAAKQMLFGRTFLEYG